MPKKDLINSMFANELVDLSNHHTRFVTYSLFKQKVTDGSVKCPHNKANLNYLCMLYGLHSLYYNSNNCFESGYFQPGVEYATLMLDAIKQLLKLLRPQIVNIVEAALATGEIIELD